MAPSCAISSWRQGREQITFRSTKNGTDVVAMLAPYAALVLRQYLDWRGRLHDRDGPLFLTPRKLPYRDNGRDGGGQNKTGFNAAKRRARRRLLQQAFTEARKLRNVGERDHALDVLLAARNDARLLRKVTQHWFRHMLATRMQNTPGDGMQQGGWQDYRSFKGYVHDVPERRRAIVASFEAPHVDDGPRNHL
jgi:hypothetical protein